VGGEAEVVLETGADEGQGGLLRLGNLWKLE
jgi:hypothetical protein